tara:strand:- start:155 stop:385 length:231 start_codon:yes stop_codon:yes gene_type:complete
MTIQEEIQSNAWLAVLRFLENNGTVPSNEILEKFSTAEEMNGLVALVSGGFAIQGSSRIWLRPDLCVALVRQGVIA